MTKLRHFDPVIFRPPSSSRQCAWCGQPAGSGFVLGLPDKPALPTVCETCCAQAALLWQRHRRQAEESRDVVTRIAVLVARRRWSPSKKGQLLPPELAASYEFLLVGGSLPSRDLAAITRPEAEAVSAAAGAGVRAWPGALRPLYLGRDVDGSLCRVYLARAWAPLAGDERAGSMVDAQPSWVPWPLTRGLGAGSSGLGVPLDEAWSSVVAGAGGQEPCRQLGEAAVRYLELREAQRRDQRADASLLPAYLQGMAEDERRLADEVASGWGDEPSEDVPGEEDGEAGTGEDEEGGADPGCDGFVPLSSAEGGEEGEEVGQDDEEGGPPEGFAR